MLLKRKNHAPNIKKVIIQTLLLSLWSNRFSKTPRMIISVLPYCCKVIKWLLIHHIRTEARGKRAFSFSLHGEYRLCLNNHPVVLQMGNSLYPASTQKALVPYSTLYFSLLNAHKHGYLASKWSEIIPGQHMKSFCTDYEQTPAWFILVSYKLKACLKPLLESMLHAQNKYSSGDLSQPAWLWGLLIHFSTGR